MRAPPIHQFLLSIHLVSVRGEHSGRVGRGEQPQVYTPWTVWVPRLSSHVATPLTLKVCAVFRRQYSRSSPDRDRACRRVQDCFHRSQSPWLLLKCANGCSRSLAGRGQCALRCATDSASSPFSGGHGGNEVEAVRGGCRRQSAPHPNHAHQPQCQESGEGCTCCLPCCLPCRLPPPLLRPAGGWRLWTRRPARTVSKCARPVPQSAPISSRAPRTSASR